MLQMPLIQLIHNAQDQFVDAVQGPVHQVQGSKCARAASKINLKVLQNNNAQVRSK